MLLSLKEHMMNIFPSDYDLPEKLKKARRNLDMTIQRHAFFYRNTEAVRSMAAHLLDTAMERIRAADPIPGTFHKEAHLYLTVDLGLVSTPDALFTAEKDGIPIIQDPLERMGFGAAVLETLRDMIPADALPDPSSDLLIDLQVQLNALHIAMGNHSVSLAFLYRAFA
jgi:hypothetical protein